MENWLDPVIKPDYLRHSATTIIKNTLTFVTSKVRELLQIFTQQNLDWNSIGRQRGTKTIRMFSQKKSLTYAEQQLPYPEIYLVYF